MHKTFQFILACLLTGLGCCAAPDWTPLLDQELSQFEVWMGVPHTSVAGLPAGTPQANSWKDGTPMGLDADVKHVFSVTMQDGEPVLRVSGEIFGGLTTLKEYGNYHFSTLFKWGEKKWPPRLDKLRDSGILYHATGEHGAFWKVWKSSLEYQVQESDLGDSIPLAGTGAKVRASEIAGTKRPRFDPASNEYKGGYISAYPEPDKPHGEWNLLELYTVGANSIHVVNGEVVMVLADARKKGGDPLVRGQIQIQSEAAECYYKDIKIRPIETFPEEIASKVRF